MWEMQHRARGPWQCPRGNKPPPRGFSVTKPWPGGETVPPEAIVYMQAGTIDACPKWKAGFRHTHLFCGL